MNKKIFFIIKINLLYISFKILYSNVKNEIYKKIELQKNLNFINDNNLSYINKIKLVFIAYQLSQNSIIQEIAHKTIEAYNNSDKKKAKTFYQKYLNKFKYSYYNAFSYYKYNNLNLNCYSIAILNLYIIIKCYKNKNIFFLIKYLYTSFFFNFERKATLNLY